VESAQMLRYSMPSRDESIFAVSVCNMRR
jgi:hypothetical protein